MQTKQDLFNYLNKSNITTNTVEHEPLFTVEQADTIAHSIPGMHIKNLFLKDDDGRLWLLVADSHAKIELKKVASLIKAPKLRFADANLLMHHLGVTPGSVSPFGLINDAEHRVTLILDHTLFMHDILNMHPLENTATTSISVSDFKKFLKATGHSPILINLITYSIV